MYKNKYLKYKNKYMFLKNNLKKIVGGNPYAIVIKKSNDAIESNKLEDLKAALDEGVVARELVWEDIIMNAIIKGNIDIVTFLLDELVKFQPELSWQQYIMNKPYSLFIPKSTKSSQTVDSVDSDGRPIYNSLLHAVIHKSNEPIVKLLIERGIDVNGTNFIEYRSPLSLAIIEHAESRDGTTKNNMPIIRLLIAKGADIYGSEPSPLSCAIFNDNIEPLLLLLIEKKINLLRPINPRFPSTYLDKILTDKPDKILQMLRNKWTPNDEEIAVILSFIGSDSLRKYDNIKKALGPVLKHKEVLQKLFTLAQSSMPDIIIEAKKDLSPALCTELDVIWTRLNKTNEEILQLRQRRDALVPLVLSDTIKTLQQKEDLMHDIKQYERIRKVDIIMIDKILKESPRAQSMFASLESPESTVPI